MRTMREQPLYDENEYRLFADDLSAMLRCDADDSAIDTLADERISYFLQLRSHYIKQIP